MKKLILVILILASSYSGLSQNKINMMQFVDLETRVEREKKKVEGALSGELTGELKDWPVLNHKGGQPVYFYKLCVHVENMTSQEARNIEFYIENNNGLLHREIDYSRLDSDNIIYLYVSPTLSSISAKHNEFGWASSFTLSINEKPLKELSEYSITLRNLNKKLINIETLPTNAYIKIDNDSSWISAPCQIELSYGKHTISIIHNHEALLMDAPFVIDLNSEQLKYDVRKKKTLSIETTPSKSKLFLKSEYDKEEQMVGVSPLSLEFKYGIYTLRAENGELSQVDTLVVDNKVTITEDNLTRQLNNDEIRLTLKKKVRIYASYNGAKVPFDIDVNDKFYGKGRTFFDVYLPNQKNRIGVFYKGRYVDKVIDVKKLSDDVINVVVPSYSYTPPWLRLYNTSFIGLDVSYVAKQWVSYNDGIGQTARDCWGNDKLLNGIRAGIHYNPHFYWGGGLYTGLFYEYYFSTSSEMYKEYYNKFKEHSLYVPVHLFYVNPFSYNISFSMHLGVGVDCGLSAKYYAKTYTEEMPKIDYYGQSGYPDRINLSGEFGISFRIKYVQIYAEYSHGIIDNKSFMESEVKTYQQKFAIGLSWVFSN